MKPKLETNKGWTEVVIDDDCEFDKFYKVAEILQTTFNITFTNKLDDFDTLYWDFDYEGKHLVLFYNIYEGITIFPKAVNNSTQDDNDSAEKIGILFFQKLIDLNWSDFDNGKTIGTKGSEGGTIINDIENSNGARVTLEKECRSIPFAITLGIYGLMFHTHFESDKNNAIEYVELKKLQINKVFEHYDVAEEKQDANWDDQHNKLMDQLIDVKAVQIDEKQKPTANSTLPKTERTWFQKLFGN